MTGHLITKQRNEGLPAVRRVADVQGRHHIPCNASTANQTYQAMQAQQVNPVLRTHSGDPQPTHPNRSSWRGRMRAAAVLLLPPPFMTPLLLLLPPNCSSRLPPVLESASGSAAARPPDPSRSLLRGRRSAWLLPLSCRSTRSARPGLAAPGSEYLLWASSHHSCTGRGQATWGASQGLG